MKTFILLNVKLYFAYSELNHCSMFISQTNFLFHRTETSFSLDKIMCHIITFKQIIITNKKYKPSEAE